MKFFTWLSVIISLLLLAPTITISQNIDFDAYKKFLEDNKNMTTEDLFKMYPPGLYKSEAGLNPTEALYMDSVQEKYKLTEYENQLLEKHGFMVTERQSFPSCWDSYREIFYKDLPAFISTDAILHTIHMSYESILELIEYYFILEELKNILSSMYYYSYYFEQQYKNEPKMKQMLLDYDINFTVALKLLGEEKQPYYSENKDIVNSIMIAIKRQQVETFKLFSNTERTIDFSQFQPRGHYDGQTMGQYFQTMMWLGRIEFYLIPPISDDKQHSFEDIQRQIIDALLILKAAKEYNEIDGINKIDNLLKAFVGESDNVNINHLSELMNECKFAGPINLLDSMNVIKFQKALKKKTYSEQKILSQILWSNDPLRTEYIKPASAFMLFGQRFIIDSYVLGNLVYDKIQERTLPTALDMLFVLGNNSASDLLKQELDIYKELPSSLAGLRYLMDLNDEGYWSSSFYTNWLQSIRALSPPDDEQRKKLPVFMQTAAWWQEKMNTQCASWAQLRHDNLLYNKAVYWISMCSYPYVYVEPIPEFYKALNSLASNTKVILNKILKLDELEFYWDYYGEDEYKYKLKKYLNHLENVSFQLSEIAQKELDNTPLTDSNKVFLLSLFQYVWHDCGPLKDGWYSELYFNFDNIAEEENYVVADIHTDPNTGRVWHVGTGKINLAVVLAKNWDGQLTAFCGPVMSYHEYITLNFRRLTDREWETLYYSPESYRPEFVNLYLARGEKGEPGCANPISLPTESIENVLPEQNASEIKIICRPNPFTDRVLIGLSIPQDNNYHEINTTIYNMNGENVNSLYNGTITSGNYLISWDGKDINGNSQATGTYIYNIQIDNKNYSGKVIYSK